MVFHEVSALGNIENNPANELTDLMPAPVNNAKYNFAYVTSTDDLNALLHKILKPDPKGQPIPIGESATTRLLNE